VTVRRLVPLTVGWQELDRSVALDGFAPGTTDRIPIPAWLIELGDALVVFDTGFDPDASPAELAFPGFPPPDVIPLPGALAAAGYDVADVDDVVLSHLMLDHAGGLRTLRPGTRAWVQRAEWEFALGDGGDLSPYRRSDLDGLDLDVRLVDGAAEPWPGVRLVPTPGHCPGHQSMAVQLEEGWVVLAADAADLQANLTGRVAHAIVLPGHDPDVWATLPAALGAVR
jgi:glyoxylase-like metal-dependent hydrolase (beta-lactamase superfamily II)